MPDHQLKTYPIPFQALVSGNKAYEIRKEDDRLFAIDDHLHLEEWDPEKTAYTGRGLWTHVTYLTRGPDWGIPAGMVVMSIRKFVIHLGMSKAGPPSGYLCPVCLSVGKAFCRAYQL